MTPTLRPRLDAELLAALPSIRDLDEWAAWRSRARGRRVPMDGLAAALRADPGLAEAFFSTLLPGIGARVADLAADFPGGVPLLLPGVPARVRLRRAAVAGLGAHLLFGTLPDPRTLHHELAPNSLDHVLADPLPAVVAKLSCWLVWLARAAHTPPAGFITLERRAGLRAPDLDDWAADPTVLGLLSVLPDDAGIEEAIGCLQVDFANRYPGGGVLGRGCVQEELRFSISPDLLATTLLAPAMGDGEAITVHGAPRVARVEGYAWRARCAGPATDPTPREPDGTPDVDVVLLDALPMPPGTDLAAQLRPALRLRELTKAFVGFATGPDGRRKPVATGNWGCGAFGGHLQLKAVIQWLAASAHQRPLHYHPYGERRLGDLAGFARHCSGWTVGRLATALERVAQGAGVGHGDLFAAITRQDPG